MEEVRLFILTAFAIPGGLLKLFFQWLALDQHLKNLRSLKGRFRQQSCFIWRVIDFKSSRTLVLMLLPWPEFLCPGYVYWT